MQDQASAPSPLPAAAVVVSHQVEDFAAWKRVFDRHATARRSAGIIATHINQDAENPNSLSVYMAATDRARLADFLGGIDLMTTMRDAGVTGPPLIVDLIPVEDLTRKDRALAGLIVRHEVRDYAVWKRAFDGHAETRAQAGIIGHAVNRSVRNPNVVVVYLQADALDALHAFAASADLKQVMQTAGVIGAPELSLVQGSEWQS